MINPDAELFRWGPIPGRPIYTSLFCKEIEQIPKHSYKYAWPEMIFYFKDEKMEAIIEYPLLRACGEKWFITWVMDDIEFLKAKQQYQMVLKRVQKLYQKTGTLATLSAQEFLAFYRLWDKTVLEFWEHALVPETANWGGEQILKQKLAEKSLQQADFIRTLEKLSAPEKLSFYQEEELSLLQVAQKKGTALFEPLLDQHTQNYFWIQNSYFETKVLTKEHFRQELKTLPPEKMQQIQTHTQRTKEEKTKIIKEFNLSKEIQKIADRLSYCIYWQDERKKQIFISLHHQTLILKEINRRTNVPLEDLMFYCSWELEPLLQGIKVRDLAERKKLLCIHYDKSLNTLTGKECQQLIAPFEKKVDPTQSELKGTVASLGKGTVRGTARILHSPTEWAKVRKGDILIAAFTSPEYIVAMRNAAAIVTDEGGMTSHAAIVSRELGVPCIVGTGAATKVFKEGEVVEVNVKEGKVKRMALVKM